VLGTGEVGLLAVVCYSTADDMHEPSDVDVNNLSINDCATGCQYDTEHYSYYIEPALRGATTHIHTVTEHVHREEHIHTHTLTASSHMCSDTGLQDL